MVNKRLDDSAAQEKRATVAKRRRRPLAIDTVEERLKAVRESNRPRIALRLAETCYECFSVEDLFRQLIDDDPDDYPGILTSLVDLEIQLSHMQDHWEKLQRPLRTSIKAFEKALSSRRKRETLTV